MDESFAAFFNKILDNHAPPKKKCVTGKHSSFMNKSLSKAITVFPLVSAPSTS